MYQNLLAKIKNASLAKKESFVSPFSNFDFEIAKILVARGYLKDIQKKVVGNKKFLEIRLNYKNDFPTISDFKIISRPSRHIYLRRGKIKRVKQGYGVGVLSTAQGVMSDSDARKKKIGGEYLFEIW
ncbi:MAG: 30S ribosomal protein S8 [Candidatus Liptonbacteria bacterium]|nr:30S ribosomal protein S8 [Candidatus Liptonbacteria bacterium]